MKSKLLIFPLLLVAFAFLLACFKAKAQTTDWQSISLNNIVKVSFPSKPEDKSRNGQSIYRLQLADSTATLACIAVNLSSSGISAEQYAELAKTDAFWQQVKQGMLQKMKNTKIVNDERFELQGLPALRVELEREIGKEKDTMYQILFIKGQINYSFSFNSRNGKGNLKTRDQFFESIKIQ